MQYTPISRPSVREIDATAFLQRHLNAQDPVIVGDVLSAQPWCNCVSEEICTFEELVSDTKKTENTNKKQGEQEQQQPQQQHQKKEIYSAPCERVVQKPLATDKPTEGQQELDDLPVHRALQPFLPLRSTDAPPYDAAQPLSESNGCTYVKIPLPTQCPQMLEALKMYTFLHPLGAAATLSAAEHPLLLSPDKYFCWMFIGQKGTWSPNHVDVMGSDAWLVVLSGRKEWVMVHPRDKNYVVDDAGRMADLFDVDAARYPNAHLARIYRFEQTVGDAVFVPSDAPHAVRNLEQTISITYNFVGTKRLWLSCVQRTMGSSVAIIDLYITAAAKKQTSQSESASGTKGRRRIVHRAFIEGLLDDQGEGRMALPCTEFEARSVLSKLHSTFGGSSGAKLVRGSAALAALGCPVGYDLYRQGSGGDNLPRLVLHYTLPDSIAEDSEGGGTGEENFSQPFEEMWKAAEAYTQRADIALQNTSLDVQVFIEDQPTDIAKPPSVLFPKRSSHFGHVPSFPPLNVLYGLPLYFEKNLSFVSLGSIIQQSIRTCQTDPGKQQLSPVSVWHYSRTNDFTPLNRTEWCRTHLFYSSPDVDGPLSLHPLERDATLAPVGSGEAIRPHFEEFQWDVDRVGACPLGLIDLGGHLVSSIIKGVILHGDFQKVLVRAATHAHGLACPELGESGIEKVMAVVLYFCATPQIVGFTYTHQFSAVSEPNTVCLLGGAASCLLRHVPTQASKVAQLLTDFSNRYEELQDEERRVNSSNSSSNDNSAVGMKIAQQLLAEFLGGNSGKKDEFVPNSETLQHWISVKFAASAMLCEDTSHPKSKPASNIDLVD